MKKILHFHVPKTGGLAVQNHFVEHLGQERVSGTILGRRLKDALVQFDHLDVISGHFLLQHGDRLPKGRYCITVVRNPVDRFLSEYFYNRSDSADRLLDTKRHALNLDAYLDQLSLREQEAMAIQIGMLYPLGTSTQTVLSLEEKCAAAVKAIDAFDLVGMQEDLDDFACMLDTRFSWGYIPLKLKNVTSQRIKTEALSPQQMQKLRALFEHELEFYHHARSRFQASRREFIRSSVIVPSELVENIPDQAAYQIDETVCSNQPVEFGDMRCAIEEVFVGGEQSGNLMVMIGEYFEVSLKIKANSHIEMLNVSLAIRDERGMLIFGTNSMLLGHIYSLEQGEFVVRFKMLNRMPRGEYHVDAALIMGESHYLGCYHWKENIASFTVYDSAVAYFDGHILMDPDVSLMSDSESVYQHKPYMAAGNQIRSFGRTNKKLREFKSNISPVARLENILPGMDICVPMRLENTSQEPWAAYGRQPVALTYRWLTKNGDVIVADGLRTRLPADVSPGMAVIVPMQISVPSEPQSLQLVVSLVQEAVAWFVDRNPGSAYIVPVEFDSGNAC